MFSLSDTITCIDNSRLPRDLLACPLTVGQDYEVLGLKKCRCGEVFVDVGLALTTDKYEIMCHCRRKVGTGTWWFDAKRFSVKGRATWEPVKAVVVHRN